MQFSFHSPLIPKWSCSQWIDSMLFCQKQSFCSLRWSQDCSQVDHPCKANSLQAGKLAGRVHAAATLRLSFTYGYGESAGERFGRKHLWPET